jgi:hypothetical protein
MAKIDIHLVLTHPLAWRARRRAVLAEALTAASARLGAGLPEPVFVAEPVSMSGPRYLGRERRIPRRGSGVVTTTRKLGRFAF